MKKIVFAFSFVLLCCVFVCTLCVCCTSYYVYTDTDRCGLGCEFLYVCVETKPTQMFLQVVVYQNRLHCLQQAGVSPSHTDTTTNLDYMFSYILFINLVTNNYTLYIYTGRCSLICQNIFICMRRLRLVNYAVMIV